MSGAAGGIERPTACAIPLPFSSHQHAVTTHRLHDMEIPRQCCPVEGVNTDISVAGLSVDAIRVMERLGQQVPVNIMAIVFRLEQWSGSRFLMPITWDNVPST